MQLKAASANGFVVVRRASSTASLTSWSQSMGRTSFFTPFDVVLVLLGRNRLRIRNTDTFVPCQDEAVPEKDPEVSVAELVRDLEDQMAAMESDQATEGFRVWPVKSCRRYRLNV